MKLPRGLRNNNPGNIEDGKFAQSLPGYVGSDGRFAVFDSLDAGAHAMQRLLSGYGRKGLDTVEGVINRWAPPTENDTGSYANTVSAHLGVKPTDKIDLNDPDTLAKLSSAMAGVENGRPVALSYVDGSAIGSAPRNDAEAAVNAMAAGRLNNIPAAHVQTVNYVPPPGSSATPQFTPLVTIPHLQPRETEEEQNATPAPPVAQPVAPVPSGDDLMRAWGIQDTGEPPPPAAATPSPDEQLIKAWGLDQNEEAPAAAIVSQEAMTPSAEGASGRSQEPPKTGEELRQRIYADLAAKREAARPKGPAVPDKNGLPADDALSVARTGVGGLIEGIPVVGPILRGGAERAAAATIAPFSDETYGQILDRIHEANRAEKEANPLVDKGAQITGAVAGTIPVIMAAPGLMGASGTASTGTNMLMGAASGGAIGAADAGVRSGGDPNAMLRGGILGGMFGGIAPAAGQVIGAGANKLMETASGLTPSGAAANNLREALAQSGKTLDDVSFDMARNPRLNPMDVDTNLQQMGMNLASQGGAPRSILNSAVESRAAGAKGAVTDAFDAAAGSVPDVKAYLDGLKATTRANAKQAFGDALTGAQPVDITPVLDSIDNVIAPGINGVIGKASDLPMGPVEQALARVRAKLANSNEMLTDADRLHTIQSNLRTEADTLAKSASGQDKLVANALRDVRQKIVDQIDNATGGKYRPAQKQYADDNAIQDAFDKGLEVFKGGTGKNSLENRPEYWADWVKNATPAELDAAKVGTRVAVDQAISSVRNAAAKGEAIADVDFNVARMEAVLGKSETQKLVQTLKDEQKIAQTNAKLFAGSQTAPRQAANKLTEVKEPSAKFSFGPGSLGAAGALYNLYNGSPLMALGSLGAAGLAYLGKYGVQAAQRASNIERNRLMAEALSGDVTKFRDAASVGANIPQLARAAQMGTNRLLTASSPAAVNLLIDHAPPKVPAASKKPVRN